MDEWMDEISVDCLQKESEREREREGGDREREREREICLFIYKAD